MIPKIIHFCWLSDDPYPEKIQMCIDSWKKFLPDYEIIHWNTKNFDVNICNWTKEAFETKQYAFVADYVRFYALYNYGGIYLDSDVEVVKPFDDLLNYGCFLGFEYSGLPEAAVVGAVPEQEWIKTALDWYKDKHFRNENGTLNTIVAPLVCKYAYETANNEKLLDEDKVHIHNNYATFPVEYLSAKDRYNKRIGKTENTYSIHHGAGSWGKGGFVVKAKKKLHSFVRKVLGIKNYRKLHYIIHTKKWKKIEKSITRI